MILIIPWSQNIYLKLYALDEMFIK
jgi:hypothetical protein